MKCHSTRLSDYVSRRPLAWAGSATGIESENLKLGGVGKYLVVAQTIHRVTRGVTTRRSLTEQCQRERRAQSTAGAAVNDQDDETDGHYTTPGTGRTSEVQNISLSDILSLVKCLKTFTV